MKGMKIKRQVPESCPATSAWIFFYRAESNRFDPKSRPAYQLRLTLPDDTDLQNALDAARKAGAPKGSHRTGIFEVQTSRGIFYHEEENRIDLRTPRKAAKVIFKTWEQLEEEETQTERKSR